MMLQGPKHLRYTNPLDMVLAVPLIVVAAPAAVPLAVVPVLLVVTAWVLTVLRAAAKFHWVMFIGSTVIGLKVVMKQ